MSPFVLAAYGIAFLLFGGYALSIWLRQRDTERAIARLDES
jgi:heme exporter protein CcmD